MQVSAYVDDKDIPEILHTPAFHIEFIVSFVE